MARGSSKHVEHWNSEFVSYCAVHRQYTQTKCSKCYSELKFLRLHHILALARPKCSHVYFKLHGGISASVGAMFFLLPSLASTILPIRSIVIQGRSRYWSSFKVLKFSADFLVP